MKPQSRIQTCLKLTLVLVLGGFSVIGRADTLGFLNHQVNPKYRLDPCENGFAEKNIQHGYGVLNRVLDGSYSSLSSRTTDGTDVVAVMWALFDASVRKGHGFEQGSFLVEDKNGYLFGFLKGNQEADGRHSSHLARATQLTQAGHYGIDILGSYQAGADQWVPHSENTPSYTQQNILPTRKGTILFIPMRASHLTGMQSNHLFIKMEDHGLKTWYGYANHAWDFLTGTVLGLGKDPNERARKERIDKAISTAYGRVLTALPAQHRSQLSQTTHHAKDLGVRVMLREVERLGAVAGGDPQFARMCQAFTALVQDKNYDHLDARTGDEVIFSEQELRTAMLSMPTGAAPQAIHDDWIEDMPSPSEQNWALNGQVVQASPEPASQGWLKGVTSWLW